MKTDFVLTMDEYLSKCRVFPKRVNPPAPDARHISIRGADNLDLNAGQHGCRCDRNAAGPARPRTLAAGFAWRAERKPLLRIDGALESRLCRVFGSTTQAHRENGRSIAHGHLFCRTF